MHLVTRLTRKSRGAGQIAVHDVSFGYAQHEPVIDNWSAVFEPGSMTALTGPSGRGKSTLLYLLGLMLRPTAGDVSVGGASTALLRDSVRARMRADHFGFVFQDAALDPTRTVLDNITETALYRGQSRQSLEPRALELLDDLGVRLPHDRKPGQISGGQAQRIALCRALLADPAVVLADEPTGNLDPDTSDVVVATLRTRAQEGATVIVVTHSPAVAACCDREILL